MCALISFLISGNLRIELESTPTCDVQMEHSYLVSILLFKALLYLLKSGDKVDFSKDLISWINGENYSLLDINMFPRPFANGNSVCLSLSLSAPFFTDTCHSVRKLRMSWHEMS
jgi:hypothetical protein